MTGTDLISLVIEKWLSFGQTVTVSNAAWRALVLHYIQKRVTRMWLAFNWTWTYQEADVTVGSVDGEITVIPPDYHACSKDGQLYTVTSAPYNLQWKPPLQLMQMLRRGTASTRRGRPIFYGEILSTIDVDGNYTGGKRLFAFPRPVTDTDLRMIYKTVPPTIADFEDDSPATFSQLAAIPSEYHETILVDGVICDLMDKAGDARSAQYEAKFIKGMAEAWADESQGQNTARRWGARYGGSQVYPWRTWL